MAEVQNQVRVYFHCTKCIEELPDDTSPMDYARLSVGMTSDGRMQVWCVRHEKNVYLQGDLSEVEITDEPQEVGNVG